MEYHDTIKKIVIHAKDCSDARVEVRTGKRPTQRFGPPRLRKFRRVKVAKHMMCNTRAMEAWAVERHFTRARRFQECTTTRLHNVMLAKEDRDVDEWRWAPTNEAVPIV